ncbi:hypothetical protein QQF64_014804 [Cirrhinus molitorella]|uniref:Uncharacterized protein n=1 Tax=Cirrhinus molitorella TaxID=172907 RepID=A0ABR3NTD1_9TELE
MAGVANTLLPLKGPKAAASHIKGVTESLRPNLSAWALCHHLGIWDNCWCAVATRWCLTSCIRGTQCSLQIT